MYETHKYPNQGANEHVYLTLMLQVLECIPISLLMYISAQKKNQMKAGYDVLISWNDTQKTIF